MITIFYETFPVAHMTFEGEWGLATIHPGKRAAPLFRFR